MNKQQGSAHVVIIIVLVLSLLAALGWIFWQNFIQKDPVVTVTQQTESSNEEEPAKTAKAPLTKTALAAALPDLSEQCSLGISDGSKEFDVNKLTHVTSSSERSGPLEYQQHGRVNEDETWVYAAGGCGSQMGGFVFKDNAGTWELVDYHLGSAWFDCQQVDGAGIPGEVVGLCIEYSTNVERAIQ